MSSFELEPRLIIPNPSPIYTDGNLRNRLWHIHGSLLCIAYLLIYPAGIVAIRSGSRHAYRYHYLLQLSGTVLALVGIALGVLLSWGIALWHQYIGLALGFVLLLQPLSGWKHHIDYLRIKRRTWISHTHLWLGRIGMGVSWVNILLGLVLRDYHFLVQAGAGIAMLCFVVVWMLWGLGIVKASPPKMTEEHYARERLMTGTGNEFTLDDLDEQSDEEDEAGRFKPNDK